MERKGDLFFFGLMPDKASHRELVAAVGPVMDRHGASFWAAELLHLTMAPIGRVLDARPGLIRNLQAVGDLVAAHADFKLEFDRAVRFGDGQRRALKLPVKRGGRDVRSLEKGIHAAFETAGVTPPTRHGADPHVTLQYSGVGQIDEPIAPVSWRVREFFLVQSRYGLRRYLIHGCWPLWRRPEQLELPFDDDD